MYIFVYAQVIFQTDASLLHQLLKRPDLRHVSAVVVDEVHERSVNTDILIALLRRTLYLRASEGLNPFRVVLTSATMNEALFAQYFARQVLSVAMQCFLGFFSKLSSYICCCYRFLIL